MRIIARFEKGTSVRFVSHLDILRLFQRAFRRADIPLAYSQGFNPHPLLAFATALPVGYSSSAEWLDLTLSDDMLPDVFMQRVNPSLPDGFKLLEAVVAPERYPSLSAVMAAADYTVTFDADRPSQEQLMQLMSGEIVVQKRTKGGIKAVDIRPQLLGLRLSPDDERTLYITGALTASGSLSLDLLFCYLFQTAQKRAYQVHRDAIRSTDGVVMPQYLG